MYLYNIYNNGCKIASLEDFNNAISFIEAYPIKTNNEINKLTIKIDPKKECNGKSN